MNYTIQKGEHYSSPRTNILPLSSHTVEATWIFDESVKYEADSENDQNKLFGLWFLPPLSWIVKNPTKLTRYNCAMVAWRWIDDGLELSPYLHRSGSLEYTEKLGNVRVKVPLNEPIQTKIQVTANFVIFKIGDIELMYEFPKHSSIAFAVQPYFGGQAVAPHDISIQKVSL